MAGGQSAESVQKSQFLNNRTVFFPRPKFFSMKQHKLSAKKRLIKPILFGALITGLATAFLNRHLFFEDLAGIRAEERARNNAKLLEVLERRQKQIEDLAEKKGAGDQ